jgi:hypothetical protein
MRFHHLERRAWLVPLALVIGVASCDVSTSPGSYYVTYRAAIAGVATIDSVFYNPGSGKCVTTCNADSSLVKVTGGSSFEAELTVPNPATVEAYFYGHGTAAGTAKLVVVWSTAKGAVQGDSATATTAAGAAFSITIPKRSI